MGIDNAPLFPVATIKSAWVVRSMLPALSRAAPFFFSKEAAITKIAIMAATAIAIGNT
ncbi:MAG: hypothetical protein LBK98_04020 [Peptococcaceae bacterium]|nr:hypothetical protein [Peptococcaceae bacterium]